MKYCSISCTPWCSRKSPLWQSTMTRCGSSSARSPSSHLLQNDVLPQLSANDVSFRVVSYDGDRWAWVERRRSDRSARRNTAKIDRGQRLKPAASIPMIRRALLTARSIAQGDVDVRRHATAAGHRHDERHASERRRRAKTEEHDRRLPPRHRCAEAERHRHDLRPARHPDHRPDAQGAGRGHARHLVPPRAACRQRRRGRRLPDAEARHLPDGVGARAS